MSDQSTLGLGRLITTPHNRDAIHIAVAPVVAADNFLPGSRVKLNSDGNAIDGEGSEFIGVVDPFLTRAALKGDTFWLFLIPGSITSLRHDWTHPAFTIEPEAPRARGKKKAVAVAEPQPPADQPNESKTWLMNFAENGADGLSYADLMDAAERYAERGEYLVQGGRFEGMGIPDEFWIHYQNVTGKVVAEGDRGSFFSCSC